MKLRSILLLAASAALGLSTRGAEPNLLASFINPPPQTRPGCYWYLVNDNISKEGITKDLEVMARVGIGRAGRELGNVAVIATVVVNGREVGTVWTTPWEIDIGNFVIEGVNTMQIRVANTWNNRLVADARLPESERLSHVSQPYNIKPDAPLDAGGLLGPVRIKQTSIKD